MGRRDRLRPRDSRPARPRVCRHRVRQPASRSRWRRGVPRRVPADPDWSGRARRPLLRRQRHLDGRGRQRPGQGACLPQRLDVRRGREPAAAPGEVRRQSRGALDQARAVHRAGRERGRRSLPRPQRVPRDLRGRCRPGDGRGNGRGAAAVRRSRVRRHAVGPAGVEDAAVLVPARHRGQGDPAGAPALHGRARRATIVEVPASHVSFVSQPEAATQLILRAVEAASHAESDSG